MKIRKAKIADLKRVHKLINDFAKREEMIPRSLNELYENLRDFVICEDNGNICGVCALHIMWEDLAEIRSLAVDKRYQKIGIGKNLVKQCLKEARVLGVKRVFALTYHPEFFKKIGFVDIYKSSLPQKIWGDCLRCPRFPECDEHAVIIYL
ncbi:MAG: N-acetyltransferase [Nitrospirota bacterium]